jgi:hypothetical protein
MSRIGTKRRIGPFAIMVRLFAGCIAAVLLPPFVMLAVAPMVLFMIPLALFAIPFMVSAFAGEAREMPAMVPRRVPALRHVTP